MAGPPDSVLFVTWPGGGNTSPVLALGRDLTAAGSTVTVSGHPSQAAVMTAAGFGFVARSETDFWDARVTATEVTQACVQVTPDLAIVDYMSPASLSATEALQLPTIALVHTLYGAMDAGGFPGPMFMLGPPDAVNPARDALGLAPIESFAELLAATGRVLVTCPREFDDNLDAVPASVRYGVTGLPGQSGATWDPPTSNRPLVVAGLGTTDMGEAELLPGLIAALGSLDIDAVVTVGDHLDPAQFDAPDNVTVLPYVDHADVMPHADLVVTHGGLGTILAALTYGVGLLVMPIDRDQPANAQAVERLGAGKTVATTTSSDELAQVIDQLLGDQQVRANAAQVRGLLEAAPRALDVIADWT